MVFLNNLNKKERRMAAAAVIFVASAVIYNFVIEPVAGKWGELNSEIESKTSELKRDLALVSAKKALEANYSRLSKYVRSGKSEDEDFAEFLSYLENLARSDSCVIVSMKPIGSKDLGSHKEILADLSSEGSVSQFMKFLYDVENAPNMILKVKHFTLTSKAGQEGALRGSFLIAKVVID